MGNINDEYIVVGYIDWEDRPNIEILNYCRTIEDAMSLKNNLFNAKMLLDNNVTKALSLLETENEFYITEEELNNLEGIKIYKFKECEGS